jgi:O-antigen ligase
MNVFANLAYFAVWFTVFGLPWESVLVVPGMGTLTRIVGVVAFGLGVLAVIERGQIRTPKSFHAFAVVFLAWGCLSFYWAVDPVGSIPIINRYVQLIALIWLLWEFSNTPARRRGLYQAYVFGAYIAVISTLLNYQEGVTAVGASRFAASEETNPNDTALLLVLALPLAWHLALTTKRFWVVWINRLYLPLGLLCVFLTGSRSALVVGMVALFLIPWTLVQINLRVRVAAVALAVICAVIATAYVPALLWQRLGTTGDELTEGTLNNRTVIWKAGLTVYPQHPIIGFGILGYSFATRPLLGTNRGAHNAYLSVLVEQGLVGLSLFLALLWTVFRAARRSPPEDRKLLLVLFFTIVIGLMPRAWEGKKPIYVFLTLIHSSAVAAAAPRVRPVWAEEPARRIIRRPPQFVPRAR